VFPGFSFKKILGRLGKVKAAEKVDVLLPGEK
jgi:hypothetical protein